MFCVLVEHKNKSIKNLEICRMQLPCEVIAPTRTLHLRQRLVSHQHPQEEAAASPGTLLLGERAFRTLNGGAATG